MILSKGAVVNEVALVKALKEGWIAGAGLDVFENEPALGTNSSKRQKTHATRDRRAHREGKTK